LAKQTDGRKNVNGEKYSATYLKTIHSQLSAIFNHAVRFYHLPYNPAQRAGTIGNEEHKEMLFWTKEEYIKFSDAIMDKPLSLYAFELLYWCGIRVGELLALTPADFDFEKKALTINKSYQRLKGRDVITSPKTLKSNRTIKMPQFLCDEIKEYISMLYEIKDNERLFPVTKSYLHHEMDRGAKAAGVKRIRIHDIRHTFATALLEADVDIRYIQEMLGHSSITITEIYTHVATAKQRDILATKHPRKNFKI
jgi:integrase